MEILKLTSQNHDEAVEKAVKVLQNGGLVVYPTETCYGIGADATSKSAIEKLMDYKTRREGKPLSVAVLNKEMAAEYAELNEIAANLYDNYLPGPITVVSKGLNKVVEGVQSEYGTLGIRIPDYQLVLDIVKNFGKPFTSTSANMSYKPKPYSVEDLLKHTPEKKQQLIDLILDAGELPKNETSTVVDTTLNNLNVMREGKLKFDTEIAKGKAVLQADTNSADQTVKFGAMTMLKYIDSISERPLVFALSGELGTGKTHFVKGLALQLHITKTINSPTYTIMLEYPYEIGEKKGKLVHIDTWRVGGVEELERLYLQNILVPGNIVAIEWADKYYTEIGKTLKAKNAKIINVKFDYLSENERKIVISEA